MLMPSAPGGRFYYARGREGQDFGHSFYGIAARKKYPRADWWLVRACGLTCEYQEAVREARADLTAAQAAQAVQLRRRSLPGPAAVQEGSPTRAAVRERESACVRPAYGLPSPYRLEAAQRKPRNRKPPPAGRQKLTGKRVTAAIAAIARGEQPEPLKRRRSEAEARTAAAEGGELEAEPEDDEMHDNEDESEHEGWDTAEEDMDDD